MCVLIPGVASLGFQMPPCEWGVVWLSGDDLLPEVSSYPDGRASTQVFSTLHGTGLRGKISQGQGWLWLKKYRLFRPFVPGHVEEHVVPK